LTARRVVKLGFDSTFPDRFQKPDRPERGDLTGIFGDIETDADMALRPKVINLVRPDRSNDFIKRTRIIQISINQMQSRAMLVRILVNVIDPPCIEGTGTPDNSINSVVLLQEKLR